MFNIRQEHLINKLSPSSESINRADNIIPSGSQQLPKVAINPAPTRSGFICAAPKADRDWPPHDEYVPRKDDNPHDTFINRPGVQRKSPRPRASFPEILCRMPRAHYLSPPPCFNRREISFSGLFLDPHPKGKETWRTCPGFAHFFSSFFAYQRWLS